MTDERLKELDCPWDTSDWQTLELDRSTGEFHIFTKTHHFERVDGEWSKTRLPYHPRVWL